MAAAAACAALTLACSLAWAQQLFELEPEYVYGRNRKPRLGYHKPEVFDPLSDRLYQSGYRDYPPTAIPDELKDVDAMTRVQKMGRILVCADGWFWPFSRTAHKNEPGGIEIEIMQAIAKKHGWEVDVSWVNMATRFGPGCAGRRLQPLDRQRHLRRRVRPHHHRRRSSHADASSSRSPRPFMSTGFVLVTQGAAKAAKTLDDVKSMHIKLGVPAYSPMSEYAQSHGFEYTTFFQNYQVIDALIRHEIDAAMIWSGAISQARLEHPEAEFEMAKGYVPVPEMRWNSAWVVKAKEKELLQFIDEAFEQMLKSGEIKRIVERYGMPFYPPFRA